MLQQFGRSLMQINISWRGSSFPRNFATVIRYNRHFHAPLNETSLNLSYVNRSCFKSSQNIAFRTFHSGRNQTERNKSVLYYSIGFVTLVGGLTYLSVILYRLYCQATGKGGRAVLEESGAKISQMKPVRRREITVNFNADTNSALMWNFKPQQPYIKVSPGETALAFYSAINPTEKPITGIATYNVLPYEAGRYFNKIQCFCFEEQQLNPKEEVDMPVFFFLDPQYAEDPKLEHINSIILSYTFFEAKEGLKLSFPSFT